MFKRTLMGLTIALAIVLVVPTTALAKQVTDGSAFRNQSATPLISEKTYGMYHNRVGPSGQELVALMARSDGLNQKYGLGQYAQTHTVVSEKTAGLQQQPTQSEPTPVVSSDNEFNWGDAGIGAGAIFVGIIVAAGAALAVRQRHTPVAH